MKVRIGIGARVASPSGVELRKLVEDLEELRFDSLWLADILSVPADDPLTGLAYAAGAVSKLKIGTTMVLPGRNPVRLAKQIATLDQVSAGRLLLTFVFGIRLPTELMAMGVDPADRGALVDEVLPLLRRLWSEDNVDHVGGPTGSRGSRSNRSLSSNRSKSGWGETSPARCAVPDGWPTAGCRACARLTKWRPVAGSSCRRRTRPADPSIPSTTG